MEIDSIWLMNTQILISTQSDGTGGATRAAFRLFTCFLRQELTPRYGIYFEPNF
jgi:hypothetical protein